MDIARMKLRGILQVQTLDPTYLFFPFSSLCPKGNAIP